jgi:hypothetical protein
MKKTIVSLTLLFLVGAGFSQEPTENKLLKNHIYLDPLPTLMNTFQISYERTFCDATKSIQISGGAIAKVSDNLKLFGSNDHNLEYGFSDEVQFRFYLNDIRNSGKENKFQFAFYFTPYIAHKYLKTSSASYDYINSVSAGLLSGWKGTYGHFVFDVFMGGGYKKSMANNNDHFYASNSYWDNTYTGILPKFGIQLGFSF